MATDLWRELFVVSGVLDRLKSNSDQCKPAETRNIFCVFEQSVFLWHASEQKLLVATLRTLDLKDNTGFGDSTQTLLLLNTPSYDVENIQINACGHLLSLSGKRGISIVELPQRWEGHDSFEGGKQIIMCKSWSIADRFFSCSKRVQVLQSAWHPGGHAHTHLVVLSNDNYLRIYNVTDPQTPIAAVPLGPQSQNYYLTSASQMTVSGCLGEVAVSFDFGPPVSRDEESVQIQIEDLVWPVYILNGNGDVYIYETCLNEKKLAKKALQGPLSMHPPAEDNYGVDACNLICLQSNPPVLAITTCAGIVHHCIVLQVSEFDDGSRQDESDLDVQFGSVADVALYVFESIELSLSLTQGDEMLFYPIKLHRDPTVSYRYHCTHSSGLHAVQLPFLKYLEKFVSSDKFDSNLLTELEEKSSIVEHLVCTRPFPGSPSAPVLGLAIASTTLGATLICLLSNYEAVFLPLRSHSVQMADLQANNSLSVSTLNDADDNGFVQKLLQWFQCSSHTPLLKTAAQYTSGSEPSAQQCIELLSNVTQNFREEFLQRLQISHSQLSKRVKILTDQKYQLLQDLNEILKQREKLTDKAENLAERYEEVNTRQHQLMSRVERVTKHLQLRIPVLSEAEVQMQSELQSAQERSKHLTNSLEQIKLKFNFQQQQIEKDEKAAAKRQTTFQSDISGNQTKQIKELLSKEGASISDLIRKITWLKKDLGI